MAIKKAKKPDKFYRSYFGEYYGNAFDLERRKSKRTKADKAVTKKVTGIRSKSNFEYIYKDDNVKCHLNKKQYNNLVKNSEVLYDEMREKFKRLPR